MAGTEEAGDSLLGDGAGSRAVAAPDLSRDDGGTNGLLAPPVGGWNARVMEEGEQRGAFLAEVLEQLTVFLLGRVPSKEKVHRSDDASRVDSSSADCGLVIQPVVAQTQSTAENPKDRMGHACGASLGRLEVLYAPADQVVQAGLMRCVFEAPIRTPAVAQQGSVEVAPEDGAGLLVAAAGHDPIDGYPVGDKDPEPVLVSAYFPSGLIGGDQRSLLHLTDKRVVGGGQDGSDAMQCEAKAAACDRQRERGVEHSAELTERNADPFVEVGGKRDGMGADLDSGGPHGLARLQPMATTDRSLAPLCRQSLPERAGPRVPPAGLHDRDRAQRERDRRGV